MSHTLSPFIHTFFFYMQVLITESRCSDSRPLDSATLLTLEPHWDWSWTTHCCRADTEALSHWTECFCTHLSLALPPPCSRRSQTTAGVDVGVGQYITLVLSMGSCRVDGPSSSPLSSPSGCALQHCPG